MSYAHVDVEEIQTTKSEKLLAVVLAAFLLVGGFWAYQKLDDTIAEALAPTAVELTPADQAAIERLRDAEEGQFAAQNAVTRTRIRLEDAREAYNTALAAGDPTARLRTEYDAARAAYADARREFADTRAAVVAARPDARIAQERLARAERARFDRHELAAFFARLGFVLIAFAGALVLLNRLRARRSKALPLGLAAVGATAVLALGMGGDYVTDYIDPLAYGPLLLSVAGAALTILAFVALQRYLARRIPIRRVRKGECPFCGYPVRDGGHCAGCGRAVLGECTTCHESRRVGTAFCAACGHA